MALPSRLPPGSTGGPRPPASGDSLFPPPLSGRLEIGAVDARDGLVPVRAANGFHLRVTPAQAWGFLNRQNPLQPAVTGPAGFAPSRPTESMPDSLARLADGASGGGSGSSNVRWPPPRLAAQTKADLAQARLEAQAMAAKFGEPIAVGSTSDAPTVADYKRLLDERGRSAADTERLVDSFYRRTVYEPLLKGKDNVYVLMPSSSGENKIPSVLAARLQRDFGGLIVDAAENNSTQQSKNLRTFTRKLQNPRVMAPLPDVDPSLYRAPGKNTVIVDDIHTTGDSSRTLRQALGLPDQTRTVALAVAQPYRPTRSAMTMFADDLYTALVRANKPSIAQGLSQETTREFVREYFANESRQLLNYANKDLGESTASGKNADQIWQALDANHRRLHGNPVSSSRPVTGSGTNSTPSNPTSGRSNGTP